MTVVSLESLTFGLGRLVEAADELGERLCLLTRDRSWYAHELAALPPGALDVVDVETFDPGACAEALARVPSPRGLINSTDTWGLVGAELAAEFKLPALDREVIALLRDKGRVRALLHARGLSRAGAVDVDPAAAGAAAAVRRATGLPAVLKDSAGTGSQNVWLARDPAELDAALDAARHATLRGRLLAEPFLSGPVYSAETLTWRGDTRLLGVSSRLMSPEPRFREEVTALPVAFPEDDRSRLEHWLSEVLAALGYTDRFAHVEFAWTLDGPEIIEVNPRIGGALVGEGLCRSLGYNVYRAMVELALGRRPELLDLDPPGGPAVAFVLGYPDRPGTLAGVSGLERLEAMPGSPRWFPTKRVGDPIEHLDDSRGYAGIVCAEGATAELATHRAVAAANVLRVRTRPEASPSEATRPGEATRSAAPDRAARNEPPGEQWYEDEDFWVEFHDFLFSERRVAQAEEILETSPLFAFPERARILDLACGAGVFTAPLARRGHRVTGLDRSAAMLERAAEACARVGARARMVRADMREHVEPEAYDVVLSLFTSFGYFEDPADNLRVLRAAHDSLVPGGELLMDLSGKEILARRTDLSRVVRQGEDLMAQVDTVLDDWTRMRSDWTLVRDGRVRRASLVWFVYSAAELRAMLREAGFTDVRCHGGFDARPYDASAERLVIRARRAEAG
ncbi:methyltransferase domain-containing protein [Allostreptomyces psammosilenae]|uniref:Biotin carboxylase/SAM-dependent methyltransferase n=1 Tax=Allostreptomyces psammosilenae TaxID=1892865 RepID=A0A852ZZK3_9ACTN|nr:methyltransferase domain-containing protein [Allostreptomyces psammosilenae]NYI03702.1 biotin carboxylase/SAM-dependent methyltransferase [Allostreptomyces psammosilenae]